MKSKKFQPVVSRRSVGGVRDRADVKRAPLVVHSFRLKPRNEIEKLFLVQKPGMVVQAVVAIPLVIRGHLHEVQLLHRFTSLAVTLQLLVDTTLMLSL